MLQVKSIKQWYQGALRNVTELVAPSYCSFCKIFVSSKELLCLSCTYMITPVPSITIPVTPEYGVRVLAVSAHQDPLKRIILAKQWSDVCASNVLGNLMWQMTNIQNLPVDYFIPVPLHWTRFAQRGFNQAEEIALVLSKKSGKPLAHIIKRNRRTHYHAGLPAMDRVKNVHGAFSLSVTNPELYRGKHLVLVDDLMTTGSTLHATAQELIKLRPASITALVACRSV